MTVQIYQSYIDECAANGERYCNLLKSKGKLHQVCKGYDTKRAKEGFSYTCPFLNEETVKIPVKQNDHHLSGIQMQDFFICNRPREEK